MRVPITALGKKGTCTNCGMRVQVPKEAPSISPEDLCDACGKIFRGDWDRHETQNGTCCHICFNQSEKHPPPNEPVGVVEPDNIVFTTDYKKSFAKENLYDDEKIAVQAKRRNKRINIAIPFIFTAAIFTAIFRDGSEFSIEGNLAVEIVAMCMIALLYMAASVSAKTLSFYIVLKWADNLPNDKTWQNILVLATISAFLYCVEWTAFGGLISSVLALVILWTVFETGAKEIIAFIVTSWIVAFVFKIILRLSIGSLGLLWAMA